MRFKFKKLGLGVSEISLFPVKIEFTLLSCSVNA